MNGAKPAVPRETLEWLDAAILVLACPRLFPSHRIRVGADAEAAKKRWGGARGTEYEYEQRLNAVDVLRHLRAIRQALVS